MRKRLWLSVALTFGLVASAEAQQPRQPFGGRGAELVPAQVAEKLKLSADQKEKLAKIQADYEAKTKDMRDKLRAGFQGGNREDARKLFEEMRTVRQDFEGKFTALLSDEQKKTYQEAREQGRGFGGGGPGGFAVFAGRGQIGQILPAPLQEQLKLTAEQKEKLEKLQKETEGKLNDILTAEPKKQLEELRQRPRQRPGQATTPPRPRSR